MLRKIQERSPCREARNRCSPDRKKLEKLRDSFDTTDILAAVDVIDGIRARVCEPDQMRKELLLLHSMAHTLINGAQLADSSELDIWELADELNESVTGSKSCRRSMRRSDSSPILPPIRTKTTRTRTRRLDGGVVRAVEAQAQTKRYDPVCP